MQTNIVVADDSMFARMLVKEAVSHIFESPNFIEVHSGEEVLNKQQEVPSIDWYLLDINMGEPNGYDTAKILLDRGVAAENISLITGNKSTDLQAEACNININFINKAIGPADVEQFVDRLKTFFKKH